MSDKKRILVVEDEPEYRAGIRMRLEANGYEVIEAGNGEMALDLARNERPDLIILDLMLPKMHGHEVARQLQSDEKCKKIPIVMLTVLAQQSDKEIGIALGADAYITKPFKSKELLQAIAELLSEK